MTNNYFTLRSATIAILGEVGKDLVESIVANVQKSNEYQSQFKALLSECGIHVVNGEYFYEFETSDASYKSLQRINIDQFGNTSLVIKKDIVVKKKQKAFPNGITLSQESANEQLRNVQFYAKHKEMHNKVLLTNLKNLIFSSLQSDKILEVANFIDYDFNKKANYLNAKFANVTKQPKFGYGFTESYFVVSSDINDTEYGLLDWQTKTVSYVTKPTHSN